MKNNSALPVVYRISCRLYISRSSFMSPINQCILVLFIGSFYLFSCKYQFPSSWECLSVYLCSFCVVHITLWYFVHRAFGNVPSLLAWTVIRPHCFCVSFSFFYFFFFKSVITLFKLNKTECLYSTNASPLYLAVDVTVLQQGYKCFLRSLWIKTGLDQTV